MSSRLTDRQSKDDAKSWHPSQARLQDVVIAFDLDNTLLDPTGEAYEKTVREFASLVDIGIEAASAFDAYEHLRARSKVFERLGLRNPNHDRGNADILAVLCMTHARNPKLCRELGIDPALARWALTVFDDLHRLEAPTRSLDPHSRLKAEIKLRHHLWSNSSAIAFCAAGKRIAHHTILENWARQYCLIEQNHPPVVGADLLQELETLGAIPVVITEGRCDTQREKLVRAGILERLSGRILISESGGEIPDSASFQDHMNACLNAVSRGDREVLENDIFCAEWLAYFVLSLWQTKSPAFYGRCLHAIHAEPHRPESSLLKRTVVPASQWSANPLHFVMIGDRYDRDIAPLLQLLGPGVALKFRLQCGKYASLDRDADLEPARRPDKTFVLWDQLSALLTENLQLSDIPQVRYPPGLAPITTVPSDALKPAIDSPFETARCVADTVLSSRR
ncbi:MAG: hypothetical protein AABZ47_03695 [Planctomycetota bacterium]